MSKEINCLFYEGIDKCTEKECYNNILGMCVKKGSANNKVVKPFTNFQHLKMLNVDEMAEFLDGLTKECGSRECGNCPLNIDDEECSKKTIKKWLESEFEQ